MSGGITLTQMQTLLGDEAERIGIVQKGFVDGGTLKAPDPGNMQLKAALEAACRLAEFVDGNAAVKQKLMEHLRDLKRAAAERSPETARA